MSRPIKPENILFEIDVPIEYEIKPLKIEHEIMHSMHQPDFSKINEVDNVGSELQKNIVTSSFGNNITSDMIEHETLSHFPGNEPKYEPASDRPLYSKNSSRIEEEVDKLMNKYGIPASDRDRILYSMYAALNMNDEQQTEQEQQEQGQGRTF